MMIEQHAESNATPNEGATPSVSSALIETLKLAGCRRAFGILGGPAVPLFSALVDSGLAPIHARHESAAVFMALEHDLAGGGPGLVFTTTGPGLTNALTGIAAAREEGGRVVVFSALTGPDVQGRFAFQASDGFSLANRGLYAPGGWFDDAFALQSAREVPSIRARLLEGLRRPQGYVAHVAVPLMLQEAPAPMTGPVPRRVELAPSDDAAHRLAEALGRRTVVWVGHGARDASAEVRALVERLDARVMCSPRGKGVFPASDSRFLGVTGFGGHEHVFDRLERFNADTTLVLGSRLGELTSFWDPRLVEGTRVVHVDVEPSVFGVAYPLAQTVGVCAEVGAVVRALLNVLPPGERSPAGGPVRPVKAGYVRTRGLGVSCRALMGSVQRVVVEGSVATVLAEAGNAFVWATHLLRFAHPRRFRVSMGFGSMGHMAAGAIGTALASGRPAVALVGDGSMLMSNEITTAVQQRVPVVWVVLNDGCYGLVADGMRGLGHRPHGLDIPHVDFAEVARVMGARGISVQRPCELDAALHEALAARAPVLIDVRIDPDEPAPLGARNRSLAAQGVA